MRRMLWAAVGMGISCALWAYLLPGRLLLGCALGAALLWAAFQILDRKRYFRPVLTVLFGCAMGFAWCFAYHSLFLSHLTQLDGQILPVTVRAGEYSFETDYGSAVDVTLTVEGKTCKARAYLREERLLSPGDTLSGAFRFRVTTPDGAQPSTYHKGRGIFLLLYQKGDLIQGKDPEPAWLDRVAMLRKSLKTALTESLPPDTVPFAKALLLGDTSDLDYETDTAFKVSGIRHVVAVSGLHVSILFALLSIVTFKNRFLNGLLGFPLLLFFGALAGFTPSVTRACLMWSLILLARLLDKEYDSPTALGFASMAMLFLNPLVVSDVGFQLSVSSVAGIYLFSERIRKWLFAGVENIQSRWIKGLLRGVCASAAISVSATLLTTPLCALYFGMVSLAGVVTNLLVLWVISFIFYGLAGICALYVLWPGAAALLGKFLAWPVRYVLGTARLIARNPMAAVYTSSRYIVLWLIFAYILLGILLLKRRKEPVRLLCCSVIGLCVALLLSWNQWRLDDVRFTVLDVGQGQCLLFQTEGRTIMVDCGGDSDDETADLAAQTLLSQGITKLDVLILTHYDRDHSGGVHGLLSRVDTELLILPPYDSDTQFRTTGKTVYAEKELILSLKSAQLRIFPAVYPGNTNENSLCVLFDSQKCDILVTGDRNGFGERSLLRNAQIGKVDVLVAGHHGSKNASCEELLGAVRPSIVCISSGRDNSYGHPAPELLKRLEAFGCTVYRTDLHGEIVIRR